MGRSIPFSIAAGLSVALFCGAPSTANAVSVTAATEILIQSNIPDFLQVGEVIATEIGTGIDVALASNGGSASAASLFDPSSYPGRAIDGSYPNAYPLIYHSASASGSEYLDVLLGHPSNLASLTIYGRTDGSQQRDIYSVVIYDALHQQLYSGVLDARTDGFATVNFDAAIVTPVPAALPLFATGLAGLGWLARRRRKQAA